MSTTQTAAVDGNDVESGKLFAILSYIIPFFFLVPLIQRTNSFARFHARQAVSILLLAITLSVVAWFLPLSLLGIVSPVFLLAQLTMIVIGIVHAARGEAKQLPILGEYAERFLQKLGT
ncbi:MAG: DUF4870 domain-containing protein [Phycisphaerales bacterium]|nr:DUF4870 domain-containing protein [Phycisphaerales bacterium]MCB9855022.1 DUF4870 domain-containing protein [Phycisphaerales bacterium]MCB9863461.1 DUF4870 domain-containing protein [Phycisphaerales bacterium]